MSAAKAVAAAAQRILVLGGSTEGFAVAKALSALGYDVISSFAGRTRTRRTASGTERVGGFGGVTGLAAFLAVEDVALVIDATHPFAAQMKRNATAACVEVGVALIHVDRPEWTPEPGDDWRFAPDAETAASLTPATNGACFVTLGRQQIHHFERRRDLSLLFRVIDPPERPFVHPEAAFIRQRGPFALDDERVLFAERGVTCLVAKNSGSSAAEAKLVVARELGLPVVIVDRPPAPEGDVVGSVDEAVAAASAMLGLRPA